MAKIKGQLNLCDRCNCGSFSKYIGEGVADGGYTTWDKFQPLPEGWEHHSEVGLLCPSCNKEFKKAIEDFKNAPELVVEKNNIVAVSL